LLYSRIHEKIILNKKKDAIIHEIKSVEEIVHKSKGVTEA
jgi:hypothetical protein